MHSSRRDLIRFALASSAAAMLPTAYSHAQTRAQQSALPAGTRRKFNLDGSVRPFAGNTVISHLPAQGVLRDLTVALHDSVLASPFSAHFAVLPTDSYHMTVFGGANDQDRVPTIWPSDIPIETPIEECTRILNARLASFKTTCPMPIRMKIDSAATNEFTGGCTLRLVPADDAANHEIRGLRDQLAEVFRLRATDHATYVFHITIAYSLGQLQPSHERAYRTLLADHVARITSALPVIELGLPEFCSFRDMYRYDVLSYLQTV